MTIDKDTLRAWHRLFGLVLTDFFTGTPFTVEIESDLSTQQQFLDVLILRRGGAPFDGQLPDGLEDLAAHNLVTFKSRHEALDDWTMKELIGHYVAYRKLASDSPSNLLTENQFRLYAVCARFPQNLSGQVPWQERQAGVYDCQWGTDVVRVIVAGQLPREDQNAALHLFSASPEVVNFGRGAYRQHSTNTSSLIRVLFEKYKVEEIVMAYTMEDFQKDYAKANFGRLTREDQIEVLQALPLERRQQLVKTLPAEVLQSLALEVVESLPLEDRLAGTTKEQIQQYLNRLEHKSEPTPRKPRGRRK